LATFTEHCEAAECSDGIRVEINYLTTEEVHYSNKKLARGEGQAQQPDEIQNKPRWSYPSWEETFTEHSQKIPGHRLASWQSDELYDLPR
jgi:hypothetical protein